MTADQRPSNATGYKIYTRAFDRVVKAEDLGEVLGPLSPAQTAVLDEAWAEFQNGLAGWKTKVHVAALEAADRVRAKLSAQERADTVVSILVDQSGSMRGQAMLLAAAAADVGHNFLIHLSCRVEVLGFTTASWRGGPPRRRWLWRLMYPRRPGRICELLHIIYADAEDQRAGTGNWNYRAMLRPDLPKENVDGEALEWAAARLRARPERRKILVVLSDGAPVDDATLAANGADYLDRHLRLVVDAIEQSGDIELVAIGIGFDVGRYYTNSKVVQTPKDLGAALVGQLEETLGNRSAPEI